MSRVFVTVALVAAGLLAVAPAHAAKSKSAKSARSAAPPPAPSALAGLQFYSSDGGHSAVTFAVPWMGLSNVHGWFSDIRATLAYDSVDVTRSSITVVIGAQSLTTANDHRDKDLKSKDWFDVEKFPRILFRSTSIERAADGLVVRGDLTIRDVTKPVTLQAASVGALDSPFGHRRAFTGTLTVARADYGLVGPQRFNAVVAVGKKMIGDDVRIELELQATAQTADKPDGPLVDSLATRLAAAGMATLAKEYRAARAQAQHPDSMAVDESTLNTFGYRLLRHAQNEDALAVFGLEAESFPASAFPYVGLGYANAALGRRAESAQQCRRALEITPAATRAMEVLRRVSEPATSTAASR